MPGIPATCSPTIFRSDGFALDISADALRHGIALMDRWGLVARARAHGGRCVPPAVSRQLAAFRDTFQTLSQFLNMDAVFPEVQTRAGSRRGVPVRRRAHEAAALAASLSRPLLQADDSLGSGSCSSGGCSGTWCAM